MSSCPEFSDVLMLDAFGELTSEDRWGLERHLKTCHNCRQERQHVINLLQRVKEAMPVPELSEEEQNRVRQSIASGLQHPRSSRLGKWDFRFPLRPLPALVAGLLIAVGVGWYVFWGPTLSPSIQSVAKLETEEKLIVQQLDLLENLDLLREMETIQKLVRVVDHQDTSLTQE